MTKFWQVAITLINVNFSPTKLLTVEGEEVLILENDGNLPLGILKSTNEGLKISKERDFYEVFEKSKGKCFKI